MRIWKRALCGVVEGDPYEGLTVECDRRKNHRGDHHAVVTWPQYVPPPPRDPNAEPTGLHFKPELWGKVLEHQMRTMVVIETGRLRAALFDEPIRVVNRDDEPS